MPKKSLIYTIPCNLLLADDGTRENLEAIAYQIGRRGRLGEGAREAISRGIAAYIASLSPTDKRAYQEILDSVQARAKLARQMKRDNPEG